jgi:ABC-type polysaccharide/polyol phosphate export permease
MHPKLEHLLRQRHLLRDFVGRDLQAKYVGSTGGIAWAVVHPLLLLLVYTFVFSVILQVRFGTQGSVTAFALYLYCGLLPWHAFSDSAARSTSCLVQNRGLIKNVRFPAKVLPATMVLTDVVSQGIGLGFLIAAGWFFGHTPAWPLLLLPVLLAVQILFTLGIALALATVNVYFRDVEQFVRVGLMIWMFLTPIFYPKERIPEHLRFLQDWNPMARLVGMYRAVILDGRPFALRDLAVYAGAAALSLALGYALFTRNHRKFADLL